ncbi:T-complex protein 11 [Xylariaceae sp. FL0594]|nr:T-complex protein 11 [Xylariaceae sp. FL0594]
MSEAISNPRDDDQIQKPTKQTEKPQTKGEDEFRKAGSRSTLPNTGLNRNPFNPSTQSSPEPAARPLEPPLRHDINFDPELHLRPDLDGEKGRRKQQNADQFWDSLRGQLQLFITDREGFILRYGHGEDWCLPMLLKAVKGIIQTLVPSKDRLCLDEGLNVELIMQQLSKGMADLEKLASWLSGILKSHCAPKRDKWVDHMYSQVTNGNRTNNMGELVQGLRNLLGVLEAMKLDVANDQIWRLRPILIEDTLPSVGDLELLQAYGETAGFFEELVNMILPSHSQHKPSWPNTFLFDEERIAKLRRGMLDAVNLEVCMRLYDTYESLEKSMRFCEVASAVPSPDLAKPLSDAMGYLSLSPEEGGGELNLDGVRSRPSSMLFSKAGSANSPPRSPLILPSYLTAPEDPQTESRELYASLRRMIQTSTGSRGTLRWTAIANSLALQIFRFTKAPADMLAMFEQKLESDLGEAGSPTYSPLFLEVEQSFRQRLRAALQVRVKGFKGLTGVSLFSVATGARVPGPPRTWGGPLEHRDSLRNYGWDGSLRYGTREDGGIEDMATRLAHLGLLHWRVWAQLVYFNDGSQREHGR